MSVTATAAKVAGKIAVNFLTSRKKRSNLPTLLLMPVTFLFLILSCIFYQSPDPYDPYLQAVSKLAREQLIESELDGNLIRLVQLLNNQVTDDVVEIQVFILDYFVTAEQRETEVNGELMHVTYRRFLHTDEIMERLKRPPFSFDEDLLAVVKTFIELGGDGVTGSTVLTGPYPRPCEGYVSSPWGMREDPLHPGTFQKHNGLDLCGDWHQPIHAIADGEVTKASRFTSGYGNFVIIRHDTPEFGVFSSLYAHLSQIDVKEGDTVTQGQVIGLEGGEPGKDPNPGDSTGHHLHLQIQITGSKDTRDPANYIS